MIAGVDGCKDKWIAVVDLGNNQTDIREPCSFLELYEDRSLDLVVIDIPIGLPDRGDREADLEARRFLGKCGVCVFTAPIRPILCCETWEEACQKRASIEGKKISKQQFGILDKVCEVDTTLRKVAAVKIKEGHPEISFALMNGGVPLLSKHKTEGRQQRRDLLVKNHFPEVGQLDTSPIERYKDILDAYAMLWTARRITSNGVRRFPSLAVKDKFGLSMEIAA